MFRVKDGWSVLELQLEITPEGPKVVGWETAGPEAIVPKNHADNVMRVKVSQRFLFPELSGA